MGHSEPEVDELTSKRPIFLPRKMIFARAFRSFRSLVFLKHVFFQTARMSSHRAMQTKFPLMFPFVSSISVLPVMPWLDFSSLVIKISCSQNFPQRKKQNCIWEKVNYRGLSITILPFHCILYDFFSDKQKISFFLKKPRK